MPKKMNNLNPTKNPKSRHILQNTVRDLKCQCFSKLVFPVKERLKNCSRLKKTRDIRTKCVAGLDPGSIKNIIRTNNQT